MERNGCIRNMDGNQGMERWRTTNGVVRLACRLRVSKPILPISGWRTQQYGAQFSVASPLSKLTLSSPDWWAAGAAAPAPGNCISSSTRSPASSSGTPSRRPGKAKPRESHDGGKARRGGRAGESQTDVGGDDENFSFPFPFLPSASLRFFSLLSSFTPFFFLVCSRVGGCRGFSERERE